MKEFVYSYPMKVYFGEGAARKAIAAELGRFGKTVMLAYGGGSIKKSGVYDEMRSLLTEAGKEIVDFSELGEFIEMPLRNYSSGMITRLAFSIATVVKPDILIVDEILSVGDAAFQKKSKNRMMELMSGGTTVLLVSHSAEQITEMCSRAIWLEKGKMKMIGPAADVCRAYEEGQA